MHPTRRRIFAGKPYSTFRNIWDLLISCRYNANITYSDWPTKILESRNPSRDGMQRSKAFTSHRAASGLLWFREMLLWCYFSDFSFSLSLSSIFPLNLYTLYIDDRRYTNNFLCFWDWDKISIFCLQFSSWQQSSFVCSSLCVFGCEYVPTFQF